MSDYPTIRPRLLLDFANSKKLDRRITFRRSSTGTYVGVDGLIKTAGIDEPRFDHDPVTGVCKGLLVEEQRTNLLLRSEEFDTGSWSKTNGTVIPNNQFAPNGTATADTFVPDQNNLLHRISITGSSSSNTHTASVYAKANRYRFLQISGGANVEDFANFDLLTGTVTLIGNRSQASILALSGGWHRCSVVIPAITPINVFLTLVPSASSAWQATGLTGDGISGISLWGAQLEAGSFPTSYIPTVASTVTRSVDSASITGTDFSSFYSTTGSTILAYGESLGLSTGNECITGVGSSSDGAQIRESSAQMLGMFRGTYGADANANLLPPGLRKMCIAYAPSQLSVFGLNGLLYFGGRAASQLGSPSFLGIGRSGDVSSFSPWNGTVNRIAYWPKRLPDAQLQALTRR